MTELGDLNTELRHRFFNDFDSRLQRRWIRTLSRTIRQSPSRAFEIYDRPLALSHIPQDRYADVQQAFKRFFNNQPGMRADFLPNDADNHAHAGAWSESLFFTIHFVARPDDTIRQARYRTRYAEQPQLPLPGWGIELEPFLRPEENVYGCFRYSVLEKYPEVLASLDFVFPDHEHKQYLEVIRLGNLHPDLFQVEDIVAEEEIVSDDLPLSVRDDKEKKARND